MAAGTLHALRHGQGPLLLLLHGIGSSATAWQAQMHRLGNAFDCLAPDLPGYGDSPDPAQPGLDPLVDALAALLPAGEFAHVLGVSFGGLAALRLAQRHPARVRSLVLCDATLGRAGSAPAARAQWLQHREVLAAQLASRSLARAAEIAGPGAPPEVVADIAAHMRRARPAGYLNVAQAIADTDATAWLSELRQRALVLCGEHDTVTGLAVSQQLAHALPGARLVRIAGAGHAPHLEQPAAFEAAVRGFLAAQPGPH